MTTTVKVKPVYYCSSCNEHLDSASHILQNKHYCNNCFKLYDTPYLSILINICAYILLIGSLIGIKGLWPSGYSFELTAIDYLPAISTGLGGFITFFYFISPK